MNVPGEVIYFVTGLVTYFVGAIPFGWVTAKLVRGIDLRKVGSGNIGATNAARELGTGWFFPIFTLDFLKGFAPTFWLVPWVAQQFPCDHCPHLKAMLTAFCGLLAMAGHLFPVYLSFKGGKGVATGAGVLFAVNWLAGLICVGVWVSTFLATRYISMGSVMVGLVLPFAHYVSAEHVGWTVPTQKWIIMVLMVLFSIAVLWKHRENLKRLKSGTEPKVRFSKG